MNELNTENSGMFKNRSMGLILTLVGVFLTSSLTEVFVTYFPSCPGPGDAAVITCNVTG